MNAYVMKIREKFIHSIEKGVKRREYRLNDDLRSSIKPNDRLVLVSSSNHCKYICVKVKGVERFPSWEGALRKYWEEDFKGIYQSLGSAIKECYTFYDPEDVMKYGIVVFAIEPYRLDLKQSKVLLDTNVLIDRESITAKEEEAPNGAMTALKYLNDLGCQLFVSGKSIQEISKYHDKRIANATINKVSASYNELIGSEIADDALFRKALEGYRKDDNGEVDDYLLWQLYTDRVDFLFTNDNGLFRKAEALFLSPRVLTTPSIMSQIEASLSRFPQYKASFIRLLRFRDVNISDVFFDSLKEDYPGFEAWFRKKSSEPCYVYEKEDGIKGFLYIKEESESESYEDFEKPFIGKKKRLKVGTFKICSTGVRLGERFIQIIIGSALARGIDQIYVTLFEDKRQDVVALKNLLLKWGFDAYTHKKSNGELVLVKDISLYRHELDTNKNYPLWRDDPDYYFLPILFGYHDRLFPDLRVKGESGSEQELACHNALEKIYITKHRGSANPGDVLLIYRMGERNKKYTSCVTGIAILKQIKTYESKGELIQACKNITVFDSEEIGDLYEKGYRTAVSLIYIRPLKHKVILDTLYRQGIIDHGKGPRVLEPITKMCFDKIIDLSEADKQ